MISVHDRQKLARFLDMLLMVIDNIKMSFVNAPTDGSGTS
jgi:hypothetical protein